MAEVVTGSCAAHPSVLAPALRTKTKGLKVLAATLPTPPGAPAEAHLLGILAYTISMDGSPCDMA